MSHLGSAKLAGVGFYYATGQNNVQLHTFYGRADLGVSGSH